MSDKLQEIRERLEKATKGPYDCDDLDITVGAGAAIIAQVLGVGDFPCLHPDDEERVEIESHDLADFFAHSWSDIAYLLSRLLLAEKLATALRKLIASAECIRHWHNTGLNDEGMIVSSEHVVKLWDETKLAESALSAWEGK